MLPGTRPPRCCRRFEAAKKLNSDNCERRNYWSELSIWSLRRLGQLIREGQEAGTIAKRGGDRKSKLDDQTLLTLEDLGITNFQSHRAQKILDVPEERLQEYLGNDRRALKIIARFLSRVPLEPPAVVEL